MLTTDERSNQVVLRMSYRVEWVSKPWGLTTLIEHAITNQVNLTAKTAATWFPARTNEWLTAQKIKD